MTFLKTRLKNKVNWYARRLTSTQRTLPNCLIVGAQKSGTSSLYQYMLQHPQVHESLGKEVHYFDGGLNPDIDTFNKGENWYRAHFPLSRDMNVGDICIDATPMYLFNPLVAERIKNLIPDCKIIILLRDPVERAVSHYFHTQRHGFEDLSIEDALDREDSRLEEGIQQQDYKDLAFRLYSYKARGLYLKQIQNYQQYFSEDQMLILSSDSFYKNSQEALNTVFDFLDINVQHQVSNLKLHNVGGNKQEINPNVYQNLNAYFEKPNQALFEHLEKKYF